MNGTYMFLLLVLFCCSAALEAAQVNVMQIQAAQAKEYTFKRERVIKGGVLTIVTSLYDNRSGKSLTNEDEYILEDGELHYVGDSLSMPPAEKEGKVMYTLYRKAKEKFFHEKEYDVISQDALNAPNKTFNFNRSEFPDESTGSKEKQSSWWCTIL